MRGPAVGKSTPPGPGNHSDLFDAPPPSSGRAVDLSDIAESEPPSRDGAAQAALPLLDAPEKPRPARQESHPDVDFLLGLTGSPGTTAALASPSLADLARKAPSEPPPEPPAAPAPSSAAATKPIRPAAAVTAASATTTETEAAATKPSGSKAGLWLALALVAVAGVGFALTRATPQETAPTATIVAAKPPEAVPAADPAPAPQATAEAVPAASADADKPIEIDLPEGPPPTAKPTTPSAAKPSGAVAKEGVLPSSANEPSDTEAKPSAPSAAALPRPEIPKAAAGTPFDRDAAAKALATAAANASSNCKKEGDPSGVASVQVTFAPSGRVTSATVSGPPFSGTATGGCIASTLRRSQIPAFDGEKVTVGKTIVIQ